MLTPHAPNPKLTTNNDIHIPSVLCEHASQTHTDTCTYSLRWSVTGGAEGVRGLNVTMLSESRLSRRVVNTVEPDHRCVEGYRVDHPNCRSSDMYPVRDPPPDSLCSNSFHHNLRLQTNHRPACSRRRAEGRESEE